MRILYLITRAEHGGAQVHVLDLLRSYRLKADLHLCTGEEGFLTQSARQLGTQVQIVPSLVRSLLPWKDLVALAALSRLIREVRPALVHAHSSKAGFLGRLVCAAQGVPAVFTAHGWAFTEGVPVLRRSLARWAERLAGLLPSWVVTVSEYDRRLALRHRIVRPDRLVRIHNGIADPGLLAEPSLHVPTLVMVGRFAPPKAQDILLRVLHRLRHLPWSLTFVGGGPKQPQVQELAKSLGLADRVTFAGFRDDVPRFLAESQIFCLCSHWEGLPLSILEAMAVGLPVVASDVGGVSEIVQEGVTGFLVKRGDIDGLADRLRLLLQDPQLRHRMGQAGRARYLECFTVDRMAEKTWALYERVLAARGGAGIMVRSRDLQ